MYLKMSYRPFRVSHFIVEKVWKPSTHLCPSLLAAVAPPVRESFFVQLTARARVVGREHDFDIVELQQPTVDLLLQLGERAQDDVVGLWRQLQLDLLFRPAASESQSRGLGGLITMGAASVPAHEELGQEVRDQRRRSDPAGGDHVVGSVCALRPRDRLRDEVSPAGGEVESAPAPSKRISPSG